MDFEDNFKYAIKVEDEEKPIEIKKIINFIENVKNESKYIDNMRRYSEEFLDWSVKIEYILDKIEV